MRLISITPMKIAAILLAATGLSVVGCSDPTAPPIAKSVSKLASIITCDPSDYCTSDGTGGTGSQQLSVSMRPGCLKGNIQQVPGTCHPRLNGISGGAPGATYTVRYFKQYCYSYGCQTGYEALPDPPDVYIDQGTYELDVIAEAQEVGGTGLTGDGLAEIMGPDSMNEGTGDAIPCPKNSGSIFDPFPFEEPAYDPATGQQLTDSNGNPLYKSFAREPCTGGIVYSDQPPHTQ
jgi:hypothetical protein